MAFLVNDSFRQVHQAATLAIDGLAALREASNVGAHTLVRGERRCVQLRVAAAQVKSVKAVRQSLVINRTELDNLCASIGEQIKIVMVIKTEGVIASDTDSRSAIERLALLRGCAFYLDSVWVAFRHRPLCVSDSFALGTLSRETYQLVNINSRLNPRDKRIEACIIQDFICRE